jgi:hypothetical protein
MSDYITFDYLVKSPYTHDDQIAMSEVLRETFPLLGKVSMWSVLDINCQVYDLYAKNLVFVYINDEYDNGESNTIAVADELWCSGYNAYGCPTLNEYSKFCRFDNQGNLVIVRAHKDLSWRQLLMRETELSYLDKYNIKMACDSLFPEKTS